MIHRVIPATVKDGQFHVKESLTDLEGHDVILRVEESTSDELVPQRLRPSPFFEDEMEIEVFIPSPFQHRTVSGTIRQSVPLTPCLIFPEELPDD